MTTLHPSLRDIAMPIRMTRRPVDERGFPVPFFVAMVDGKPDHRVADPSKFKRCVEGNVCWLCGDRLGVFVAFVIGPMCAVTRVSAEPPSHRDCAEYAVRACPFLSRPHAKRREPEFEHVEAAGGPIQRNPGVSLVWVTRGYRMRRAKAGNPGYLFDVGDPSSTSWWAEGRPATREQVERSTREGLPALRVHAPGALELAQLESAAEQAQRYWPAEVPRVVKIVEVKR